MSRVRSGPVVIGYDGSVASERALCEAAPILAPSPALVVVVWEAGLGFELVELPAFPPAPIDIRTALEIEEKLYERAQRLAEQGRPWPGTPAWRLRGWPSPTTSPRPPPSSA